MSENNNEQFKMPPKRPRGPMGRGPGMVTEKAKDFKGSTKKLIKYLGRYWAAIIAVMIFAAVSTVFLLQDLRSWVKRPQRLPRDL